MASYPTNYLFLSNNIMMAPRISVGIAEAIIIGVMEIVMFSLELSLFSVVVSSGTGVFSGVFVLGEIVVFSGVIVTVLGGTVSGELSGRLVMSGIFSG